MFEVWDRVTSQFVHEFATLEEAEQFIAGPFAHDFVIFEEEDED